MVHFPPLPSRAYVFSSGSLGITQGGFPHSEIPGSKLICSSPGLIAAYRVLHRLLAPRHSPYALSSLTTSLNSSQNQAAQSTTCVAFPVAPDPDKSFLFFTASTDMSTPGPKTQPTHAGGFCGSKKLPFAGYSVVKEPARRGLAARRGMPAIARLACLKFMPYCVVVPVWSRASRSSPGLDTDTDYSVRRACHRTR
jgi:hypothetical protein